MDRENLTLGQYEERLEKALKRKEALSLYNRDMLHATLIVSAAFRHAQERVLLLSNKLDRGLYETPLVLSAIEEFLQKHDTRLDILVETGVSENVLLMELLEQFDNVEIHRVPEELVKRYTFNFMLADEFGYRVESDRSTPSAAVSLHERDDEDAVEMIEQIKDTFAFLKERATAV